MTAAPALTDLFLRSLARLALAAFVAGVAWMLLLTYNDHDPASVERPTGADHAPPLILTPVPSTTPLTR